MPAGSRRSPAMSGMQAARGGSSTPSWSKTTPPPTSMKSSAHASVIRAFTLNSAASRWSTTILRPLMPPASLHHFANTVGGVEELLVQARDGRRSRGPTIVPILISVGVTPCAGEPDGLPFLQTTSLVPNAPVEALAAARGLRRRGRLGRPPRCRSRPHAATTTAMTHRNANHRKRFTSPPLVAPATSLHLTGRQVARQCPVRGVSASVPPGVEDSARAARGGDEIGPRQPQRVLHQDREHVLDGVAVPRVEQFDRNVRIDRHGLPDVGGRRAGSGRRSS